MGPVFTETNKTACKRIICGYLMQQMTADEIRERATYQDGTVSKHEVHEWLGAIAAHL